MAGLKFFLASQALATDLDYAAASLREVSTR
jgi:hypothetical protein